MLNNLVCFLNTAWQWILHNIFSISALAVSLLTLHRNRTTLEVKFSPGIDRTMDLSTEIIDKNGNYIGFVPDTINAFRKCGMNYYNEGILLNAIASAGIRANGYMKTQKLVKVHQNILIFKKP